MKRVLIVCALVLIATSAYAQGPIGRLRLGYSVIQQGTPLSCADVTTKCVPSEYATIQLGMNAANAGDIVWVAAGTYSQTPTPSASGTSGNTITLLANGVVTMCGMSFTSDSYIRVIGFTMNTGAGSCGGSPSPIVSITGTNVGLEFWNNDVGNQSGGGIDADSSTNVCNKCIIVGGSIHDISNGNNGITLVGDDTFVGYVNLSTICYIGVNPSGARDRFLNLNFSGMIQCGATHPDFFYINNSTKGFNLNLIEASYGIGTVTSSDNKFMHVQNQSAGVWTDDVWRGNVSYNLGSGFYSIYSDVNAIARQRLYNNTIVNCNRANNSSSFDNCGNLSTTLGPAVSASIYNTVFYQAWADVVTSGIPVWTESGATVTKDYNLAYDPDGSVSFTAQWTGQAHEQSNVNPLFVSASSEFVLQSGSGARGVGGPLTTATSCSGTTLNVATNGAANFIADNSANLPAYAGGLVPGDDITVGASTTRRIVSISGDAITVDASLTCSASDPVYWGTSSTIDIGAKPYKSGGYTLSGTYHQSGTTVTVTPNDATLARFAVVYENGMPKCVASVANAWACTIGTGVASVTLYPLYPSLTQSVTATPL